jgi:uncharacterized protein with FMN-binding domain
VKRAVLVATGTLAGLAGVLLSNPTSRAQLLSGNGTGPTASALPAIPGSSHAGRQQPTTTPPSSRSAIPSAPRTSGAPKASAHPSTTTTTTTGPPAAGRLGPQAPASAPTPSTTTASIRTVDGQPATIPYGVVQVRLIITGSTITDVQALQLPNADGHSQSVAQMAVPILRQQVLAAQSAQINGISGATYTSSGYAQSVQSALDSIGGHP